MAFIGLHQCPHHFAQPVIGIGGNVVEFINGNGAIYKSSGPQAVKGKAQGGMGANQNLVTRCHEFLKRTDLAPRPASRAKVPVIHNQPITEKPVFS